MSHQQSKTQGYLVYNRVRKTITFKKLKPIHFCNFCLYNKLFSQWWEIVWIICYGFYCHQILIQWNTYVTSWTDESKSTKWGNILNGVHPSSRGVETWITKSNTPNVVFHFNLSPVFCFIISKTWRRDLWLPAGLVSFLVLLKSHSAKLKKNFKPEVTVNEQPGGHRVQNK